MPVVWKLRKVLGARGYTRASQISKIIRARTGYVLSTQAVCDLLNDQPKMLRLETGQALCDAFYCCLSDFFEMVPLAASKRHVREPRLSKPLSSSDNGITQAAGVKEPTGAGLACEDSRVDFASFFPDARKFSSKLIEG